MTYFPKATRLGKSPSIKKTSPPCSTALLSLANTQGGPNASPFSITLMKVADKKPTDETMDEAYNRLIGLVQTKVKSIKGENITKEQYLKAREESTKQKFCLNVDTDIPENDTATLYRGVCVKIIRTPTSKKLGPGAYQKFEHSLEKKSYNIIGMVEKLNKRSTRSLSREGSTSLLNTPRSSSRRNDYDKLQGSGKRSLLQLSRISSRNTPLSIQGSSQRPQTSNKSTTTVNESYEAQWLQQQEQRKQELGKSAKKIEEMKRLVQKSKLICLEDDEESPVTADPFLDPMGSK